MVGARRRGILAACVSRQYLPVSVLRGGRHTHPNRRGQQKQPGSGRGGRTFSSAREKPRPARTLRLYLMVGHRTIGRRRSTGRGATAAALTRRAVRRRTFLPGCVFDANVSDLMQAKYTPSPPLAAIPLQSVRAAYLVEVTPDTALPVLSEVCGLKSADCCCCCWRRQRRRRTPGGNQRLCGIWLLCLICRRR